MEFLINNIKYIDDHLFIPNDIVSQYDIHDIKFAIFEKFGINDFNIKYYEYKEKRIGQCEFRQKIVTRDKYCVITMCHSDMCEACHIIPYSECNECEKYDINNGLLLESGIHKLFDKYSWSINPITQHIEISSTLLNDKSYELINKYNNYKLNININKHILNNLKCHYNKFKKINNIQQI